MDRRCWDWYRALGIGNEDYGEVGQGAWQGGGKRADELVDVLLAITSINSSALEDSDVRARE
jgi:alpha-L-arabinofuranosidase